MENLTKFKFFKLSKKEAVMENQTGFKLNQRRPAVRLVFAAGLALLFVVALLGGLQGVTPARADHGNLYVDGASGSDKPTCGTTILPCQTISYTLNSQASDGDNILIATGTYTENLTIAGITVTLRGGHIISGTQWLTGTSGTVINGNKADRVFLFYKSNSVLENLTITGGQAPTAQNWGGGVYVTNGDVTIRDSIITGNTADSGGAGIEVNDDYGAAHLTLELSTVSYNTGGEKGGLSMWGANTSVDVRDVTFLYNTAPEGAGIALMGQSSAVIMDTRLYSNTADQSGGGILVDSFSQVQITNAEIEHNTAELGGGIAVREGGSAFISGTHIISNTANENGGGIGIWSNYPLVVVTNTVISDNYGYHSGGVGMWEINGVFSGTNLLIVDNRSGPGPAGIALWGSGGGRLMNVTVSGNDSATGFDGAEVDGPPSGFPIVNSIFWGNGTDEANLGGNNLNVSYSDVQGGFTGTANINADPLFISGVDYHLVAGSPCNDTGTSAGAPTYDIEGTPRDATPDMGAYEFKWHRIYLPQMLKEIGT